MADYYISNSGNDAWDGRSSGAAWATVSKLNAFLSATGLSAGDRVFFERGGVWFEKLIINGDPSKNRGTIGDPVVFGAYGTGDLPILSGLKALDSWTSLGANLYEITDVDLPADIRYLEVEGEPRPKKLGPLLRISSDGTTSTIVSNNIPTYDYSSGKGEVILESRDWIHDLATINSVVGTTINHDVIVPAAFPSKEGYRYLIQNLPETLTENGDWMYDSATNKITMYSLTNPNFRSVKVAILDYTIIGVGNRYNSFKNLQVEGAYLENIRLEGATGAKVEDSVISRGAGAGIGLWTSADATIDSCEVSRMESNGIVSRSGSSDVTITNNNVSKINQYFGSGRNGGDTGDGIQSYSNGVTIKFNSVKETGYLSIRYSGSDVDVDENYSEDYCLTKADGGGFYTYGGEADFVTEESNRTLSKNIVVNNTNRPNDGIYTVYFDDNSEYIIANGCTLIKNKRGAVFFHNTHDSKLINSSIYRGQYLSIYGQNASQEEIRDNTETGNLKVLAGTFDHAYLLSSNADDLDEFGTINNNTFIFCSKSEFVAVTQRVVAGKKTFDNITLAQWRALGYDVDSTFQYLDIPEITNVVEGVNLFPNSNFDSGTSNTGASISGGEALHTVDTTSKITGVNSLKVIEDAGNQSSSTTRIEVSFQATGALSSSDMLVVRFKALAPSGHQSFNCYLRQRSWPYGRLSDEAHFFVGDTVKDFELFFLNVKEATDFNFMIDCQSHQGAVFFDQVEIRKITGTVTDYTEHVEPLYNKTKVSADVTLTGTYETLAGDPVSSPITIPSFESVFLRKISSTPTFSNTVTVSPSGFGTAAESPTGPHENGTEVTLTASPAAGKRFVRWSVGGDLFSTENPHSYFVGGYGFDFVAEFEDIPKWDVTLSADPVEGGTVEEVSTGPYAEGEDFEVLATPAAGYRFIAWSIYTIYLSSDERFFSTMGTEDLPLVAEFALNPTYTVTISVSPGASGTAEEITTGPYQTGDNVELLATTAEGYGFVGWKQGEVIISTEAEFTFNMGVQNIELIAVFEATGSVFFSLSVVSSPGLAGSVTGSGDYEAGDKVPLMAINNTGWTFLYWMQDGEVISETKIFEFTMPAENATVYAFSELTGSMANARVEPEPEQVPEPLPQPEPPEEEDPEPDVLRGVYKLNNIDLTEQFGFIPRQSGNTNLAISGCWDMPERIGKTFHDWEDQDGIEPYVAGPEIRWSGRDILLTGLLKGDDQTDGLAKLYDLYAHISSLDSVALLECELGSWNVMVNGEVKAEHISEGWYLVDIPFRQPVVYINAPVVEPSDLGNELGIDSRSFADLGFIFLRLEQSYNRPAPKGLTITSFPYESERVNKIEAREIKLQGVFLSADYSTFKSRLNGLYALLAQPGLRSIIVDGQVLHRVFVKDGVQVKDVRITGDGQVTAVITINFTEGEASVIEWDYLADSEGNIILNDEGNKLLIIPDDAEVIMDQFLADGFGQLILDKDGNKIVIKK